MKIQYIRRVEILLSLIQFCQAQGEFRAYLNTWHVTHANLKVLLQVDQLPVTKAMKSHSEKLKMMNFYRKFRLQVDHHGQYHYDAHLFIP